jgi:sortase A
MIRRRRRLIAVAASFAIAAGASLTTAAVWPRHDGTPKAVAITTSTRPPTTTTTRPPTTTTPQLPAPEDAPADPYANVPVRQIGTIEIPKIGLLQPIFEGVWLTVVDHGPGHWPGTAMPGAVGNTTFAGHRVTHSHPFLNVDQLRYGDQVIFHMPNGDFTYAITQILVVDPNAIWITNPTPKPTMTLFACHPKHSAAHRIVVKGNLIRAVKKGSAP